LKAARPLVWQREKRWLDDRAKNRNLIKKPAINFPTTDAAREQT
jgi:hypothetical protein